MNNKEILKE